jgi:peptidoglycan/xylan/chitin deacetylase (PgdA/CDA1 family)
MRFLRERWEKNWPELRAAARRGVPSFVFAASPPELDGGVPVFFYHAVTTEGFAADLRFLRENGYATLDADGLLAHLGGERPAPPRSVVLTFDDGGSLLHRIVFPLLREFGQRAVAFVAPRFHGDACIGAGREPRPCTWDELREMAASGVVDVQSHTLEHRYLPRWPEVVPLTGIAQDYLRCLGAPLSVGEDIRRSREVLEAELGRPVRHLAFPRFDGTAEAVRLGREAGFEGFWWGMQPGRPLNRPGDDGGHVVRLSGEFVRRLPGRGRASLRSILRRRYRSALRGGTE